MDQLHEWSSCNWLIVVQTNQHGFVTEPTAMTTIIGSGLGKFNSTAAITPHHQRHAVDGPGSMGRCLQERRPSLSKASCLPKRRPRNWLELRRPQDTRPPTVQGTSDVNAMYRSSRLSQASVNGPPCCLPRASRTLVPANSATSLLALVASAA